jgi:hypothetical protein
LGSPVKTLEPPQAASTRMPMPTGAEQLLLPIVVADPLRGASYAPCVRPQRASDGGGTGGSVVQEETQTSNWAMSNWVTGPEGVPQGPPARLQ